MAGKQASGGPFLVQGGNAVAQKVYFYLSGTIFGVVGLAHLLRALNQVEVRAGDWVFPIAASWVGGVAALALCGWGWALARK